MNVIDVLWAKRELEFPMLFTADGIHEFVERVFESEDEVRTFQANPIWRMNSAWIYAVYLPRWIKVDFWITREWVIVLFKANTDPALIERIMAEFVALLPEEMRP